MTDYEFQKRKIWKEEEKQKIEEEFRTAFEIVGEVLRENPQARENDMILALEVWIRKQQIKCWIPFDKIGEMINYSTIHRVRQLWQNERGQYLPENPLVLVQRRIRETLIRSYFRDNQKIINEWQDKKFAVKTAKKYQKEGAISNGI